MSESKRNSASLISRCLENSNFITIFENVINTFAKCFGDDVHLKEEAKKFLARSAANQICSYLEIGKNNI